MAPNEIDALLDLEPEELAIKMLSQVNEHSQSKFTRDIFSFDDIFNSISRKLPIQTHAQRQKKDELYRAHREAWTWLETNAFLIWPDNLNGSNGFRILSRRAEKMSIEEIKLFASAKGLSRDHLHPSIAQAVWSSFIRGQFDSAVFLAAKAVEVSVRNKTGIEEIGVTLMRSAFKKNSGPLADTSSNEGEQESRMHLFAGFIGSYKNPGSHRDVNMEDPLDAMQVVLFASHLLKLIDLADGV